MKPSLLSCLARSVLLAVLLAAMSLPVVAVEPINAINLVTSTGDTTPILNTPAATGFGGGPYDVTFTGNNDDIETVEVDIGGTIETFEFVTLADELRLRRENGTPPGQVDFVRDLLFCRGTITGTDIDCDTSTLSDMETILLGRSINFGTDNIFSNGSPSSNNNNIERVDYIYKTGISITTAANDIGFIVLERGGNDSFRLAAILTVDSNFDPLTFGPVVDVAGGDWGGSGSSYESVVFRRDPADTDYRPSADLGTQNVDGVFVSFSELGLSLNDVFYGYALFSNDVTNINADPSTFPKSGGSGLDLIEGGGFFQRIGGTQFVDLEVVKTTSTPNPTPSSDVEFTVTVSNLTQNATVITNAAFQDILPAEFSNVRWRCEAFVTGSTCLGGSQPANGSESAEQVEPDLTIDDVVTLVEGGSVVYSITATLSGSATGVVANTATINPAGGQVEISASNNTDTASITVQAPASGLKPLYFTTDDGGATVREIRRTQGDAGEFERVNDGQTETWVLDPALAADITINAPFTMNMAMRDQGPTGNRTIDFVIRKVVGGSPTELATAQVNGLMNNTVTMYTASVTMAQTPPFTIEEGALIEIDVSPLAPLGDVRLYERQSAADADMSRLTLSPDEVINVDSITFSPSEPEPGDTVTISAIVSDPFGAFDITGASIDFFNPDGVAVLSNVAMVDQDMMDPLNPDLENFTASYTIPDFTTSLGDWVAVVTATEGEESSPVTHTSSEIVTVGLAQQPELTVAKLVDGLLMVERSSGNQSDFVMTVTNVGAGDADDVVVTIDIDDDLMFGVDSQPGSVPFTFVDTSAGNGGPPLPSNFYGTPLVSINNGPFQAMPVAPPAYVDGITAVRIEMNGIMQADSQFTLEYRCEVE